jgi:hypothetical protein
MTAPSFFALWKNACSGQSNICEHFVLKSEDTIIDKLKKVFFAFCFSFHYMMVWIFDSAKAQELRYPNPSLRNRFDYNAPIQVQSATTEIAQ